jgi:RNA polymerase sigma factor for flagellar operon FliA
MTGPRADAWEPYRPPPPDRESDLGQGAGSGAIGSAARIEEPYDETSDETTLWRRWVLDRDLAARAWLIDRYSGYAKAQAAKLYARRFDDEIEFDEYFQFAVVGLLEAIERYRLERGAQFTTYATPRIRGAILNGLQHLSERRQQIAWRRRVMAERVASLAPETLSDDGSERVLHELLAVATGLALGMMLDGSGMMVDPKDSLPGNAYAQIELRELREQLWPLLNQLTVREREVIQMHYIDSRSFDEIVQTLHLSKGRVSQLHRQGLARLRALIDKARTPGSIFL